MGRVVVKEIPHCSRGTPMAHNMRQGNFLRRAKKSNDLLRGERFSDVLGSDVVETGEDQFVGFREGAVDVKNDAGNS